MPHGKESDVPSDVMLFWRRLENRIVGNRKGSASPPFNIQNDAELKLWFECWKAAAAGANGPVAALAHVLLLLPATNAAQPPIDMIVSVISRITSLFCQPFSRNSHSGQQSVSALEAVADIIRDRLTGIVNSALEPHSLSGVVSSLTINFRQAVIALLPVYPEYTERFGRLLTRVREIEQFQSALERLACNPLKLASDTMQGATKPWTGWIKSPTVGWLMSGSWHKVPELRNIYSDAEEYSETLLRIWTLLSFYWGSGAVWPRCSKRSSNQPGAQDQCCGEPLLCRTETGTCGVRKGNGARCQNTATWQCYRRDHDSICNMCLNRCQDVLCGPPSLHASTDIYDACVERQTLRREGIVFVLSGLTSRRPPRIAPNWKTTYRLQPSVLVAVTKLHRANEPIKRDYPIQWAEVVTISQSEDWVNRSKGRVAIRFLSRSDCSSLPADADSPLDIGTRVAIIDLRVFVPEVASVLATFSNDNFTEHLKQIPFINQLLGAASHDDEAAAAAVDNDIPLHIGGGSAVIRASITDAIRYSDIEVIQRLSIEQRASLAERIFKLEQVKTLYGTQLDAFCQGLRCRVHCTQGPPGTGKVNTLQDAFYMLF